MQRKGCYITQTDYSRESCIVLEKEWDDSFYSIMQKNGINHIRLSEFAGWKENCIDFVRDMPSLEGLEIYSSQLKNLSPLTSLTNLKYLAIDSPYKAIDFSAFTNLEHLYIRWRPKSESIFGLSTITYLNIVNFPEIDMKKLGKMQNLSSIKLTSQKLQSLRGVEIFQHLISIDLFKCSKLDSLKNVDQCVKLTHLEIENCKGVNDISLVKNNRNLKRISINNCGDIKSLTELRNLFKLEEIIFVDNTKIIDGDLSFFFELPKLINTRFADRKHYSIKRESINNLLGQRH